MVPFHLQKFGKMTRQKSSTNTDKTHDLSPQDNNRPLPKTVCGATLAEWQERLPILSDLMAYKPLTWINPKSGGSANNPADSGLTITDIDGAEARLERFRPFIAAAFPETWPEGGLIESPLRPIPGMQAALGVRCGRQIAGKLLLKCDNLLPISGSVKARGGIYEVLKYAEEVALASGLVKLTDDYAILAGDRARAVFAGYLISVGSTGNLGLSIGIIGARLGFQVTVHMSGEARQWKKDLLRSHGVSVVEHPGDYSSAVAEGRRQAATDPRCHFVDDEKSVDLFLGYAVAARRLQRQLADLAIPVDADHPLFVYLPCGVGGAPGGITFGLKHLFGKDVHCFFAEPTHAPCMLLGLSTGLHAGVSVQDFGLNGTTAADGLAVSRPSGFIGKVVESLVDGAFTVDDGEMFRLLALLADSEAIRMEPSALAGMAGPLEILQQKDYLQEKDLRGKMVAATHIVWGTGGQMVPEMEMAGYYRQGEELLTR